MSVVKFVDQVIAAMMNGVDTVATQSQTLSNWTDSTAALQSSWLDGKLPDDIEAELKKVEDMPTEKDGKPNDDLKKAKLQALSDFTSKYMTPDNIDAFSSNSATRVMSILNTCYNADKGPSVMALINGYQSIITAESTKQLTIGQTQVKAVTGSLQQSASAQQPLADAGNAFMALIGTIATNFQQSYS